MRALSPRSRTRRTLVRLAVTAGAVAACASCDRPAAPNTGDRYAVRCDPAARVCEIRHVSVTARSRDIDLVASMVQYDAGTHRVSVLVSLHNGRDDEFLGPRGVEAFDFDASIAWPLDAGCAPPIPGDLPPMCVFWHYDSYGDHMLSPGETSEPVAWVFNDSTAAAFQFDARLWWPHGPSD